MSVGENEDFPRGGKTTKAPLKRKLQENLFDVEKKPKAKKPRKVKVVRKNAESEDLWQAAIKFQGTLNYNTIQDGMVILSCLRHISNLTLQIEFPGLTFGTVTINNVSDAFTNKLAENLKEGNDDSLGTALKNLVTVGQLMPAKILSVKKTDKGHDVQASINPKDINCDRKHNSFSKGALVWANVVSELDHGYELTLGVNNCRVFLPFKNIDDTKKYETGEPLYCVIHKVVSSDNTTTLTVSAKQEHVNKAQHSDLTLNDLIPGMKVEFVIEEIMPNGIKGQFFDNCFGFIDEAQFFTTIKKEKLKEGGVVPAYVLYVEPITKVTYLTLRGLGKLKECLFKIGQITSAKVVSIVSRGLYLQLGKNEIGFVTNKRLLNTLPKDARLDVISAVRKKYPVDSHHDCRILDYNYMQQLYICTFEKHLIKEKIFHITDLQIGQIVTVDVTKIVSNGLIVKAGHVQGFIPNIHLSKVKYTENIKKKFSVGMTINARVLNITSDENVIFTLKEGLMEAEKCLTKTEDATAATQFVGFVIQTKVSGALIAFFGDAKGWLSTKALNGGNTGRYMDPREYFFIGQVVTVWSLGLKNNRLQVSLNLPNLSPAKENRKKLKMGAVLDGTITALHSEGLDVNVGEEKSKATVPVTHLSTNLNLCPVLLGSFQPGQQIKNLICINNWGPVPIMSRREFIECERNETKFFKFRELKMNTLLRCSYERASDSGIYLSCPIEDYHETVFIENEKILNNELQKQQCVLARVISVDFNSKKLELTTTDCYNIKSSNDVLKPLVNTLEELDFIIQLHREKGSKLTEYKIGQRVMCVLQKVDEQGNCFVTLPNGINGVVASHLSPTNAAIGSEVEGVIIGYNLVDHNVDVCCNQIFKQKINTMQDGIIKKSFYSSCIAKVLLITKFYILAVMKENLCNRQLVYLPLCSTENENITCGDKVKIIVVRRIGARIVGLLKKTFMSFEKMATKGNKKHKKKIFEKSEKDTVEKEEEFKDEVMEVDSDIDEKETAFTFNTLELSDKNQMQKESVLSGAQSFFITDDKNIKDESSSDEEEEVKEQNKKKKKLTPAEKAEIAKKEEERIAKIEQELADAVKTPQSAEQFDRLLLANPNSSELWLQYMAMHIAATELEKARAVGKKALETINMTLIEEKFNIWIALLNLENMFGTKESFGETFNDAVKYNDSLNIYLRVIKMLATSGKLAEMEEKIKKLKTKEKQSTKMWLEVGQVYYSLGKFKEARNLKEAALKSISDKKRQFDLIVKFGIMEFQSGELQQAVANFETILDTYPNKCNIWIIYVDQLVKQKKIDDARNVLERGTSQKFPPKTMKALFQKFMCFEEQHGTPERVAVIRDKAKEYVKSLTN